MVIHVVDVAHQFARSKLHTHIPVIIEQKKHYRGKLAISLAKIVQKFMTEYFLRKCF